MTHTFSYGLKLFTIWHTVFWWFWYYFWNFSTRFLRRLGISKQKNIWHSLTVEWVSFGNELFNCCVVNVFQFCYMALRLSAFPLRKAYLNVLDFETNRFIMKLFRTNNIGMVKECQSYFSFQLASEMLKQRTERFDIAFMRLSASWL